MKLLKNALAILFIATLAGCNTTPKLKTHTEYPPLVVHSDEEYEWDSDYSYAKNISMMVRTSGLGFGVDDESDPLKASNNVQGGLSKTASALTGFAMGGIFGSIGFMSLDGDTNKGRQWNPMLVDFIPVDELPDLNDKGAYLTVRNLVTSHVKEGLKEVFPDLTWQGEYLLSPKYTLPVTLVNYNTADCIAAHNIGSTTQFTNTKNRAYKTFEGVEIPLSGEDCNFTFDSAITGKVKGSDNKMYWIIMSTTRLPYSVELFTFNALNKAYKGHVLNPTSYKFFAIADDKHTYWNNPYPFVAHKGENHLFDKQDVNKKLNP